MAAFKRSVKTQRFNAIAFMSLRYNVAFKRTTFNAIAFMWLRYNVAFKRCVYNAPIVKKISISFVFFFVLRNNLMIKILLK